MASSPARKRDTPFGLSTPLLLLASGCLVLVGVAGGIGLDLLMRPEPAPKPKLVAPAPVQRPAPLPVVRMPSEEAPVPSILDKRAPEAAPPAEAEAPKNAAPMQAYAVSATTSATRPVLAVVIDDMGLDRPRSLRVLDLPGPLTVSLMTYAPDLPGLAKRAQTSGHEILAHVPMEPRDGKEKPGKNALTVAMDDEAIRAALGAGLDGWQGYVGINNHMGSRFTADPARMAVVMDELKRRGLLWLDSKTTGDSVGTAAARAADVPEVERDVFLDNIQSVDAVTAELEGAIAIAKSRGSAIVIGHPHDATIAVLADMLPKLEARGIALVPVTEVLKRRETRRPS